MGVHNLAQVEIIQDDDGIQMKVEKRKTKNEKIINIKQKNVFTNYTLFNYPIKLIYTCKI